MKAITYLKQIEMMDAQIESDLLEITRLETLATKTTATLGNERVQSSGSQEKMADCVAMIVDMRNKLNEDIDKFLSLKMEARELIANACEPDCCKLLHKRYFHYWTWEKIAVEMGYAAPVTRIALYTYERPESGSRIAPPTHVAAPPNGSISVGWL